MNNIERFETQADALARIANMAGWFGPNGDGPEAVEMDGGSGADGDTYWAIEAAPGKWLRDDGMVN